MLTYRTYIQSFGTERSWGLQQYKLLGCFLEGVDYYLKDQSLSILFDELGQDTLPVYNELLWYCCQVTITQVKSQNEDGHIDDLYFTSDNMAKVLTMVEILAERVAKISSNSEIVDYLKRYALYEILLNKNLSS